jgi:hypothetical protein|tara:strand:+ start:2513 stop:3406 length:894 start_codon:yes stop_codon:yes gene_type:complete
LGEKITVRPAKSVDNWNRLVQQQLPDLASEYPLTDEQVDRFWEQGFIVLKDVLSPDEINAYGDSIREVALTHFRARGWTTSFGNAFLQQLNLRYCSDAVMRFVSCKRFGRIASRLLRTPKVRIYHEQALFKQPGGIDSHWHQDQFYFPFDDSVTMGLWMPLVDCSLEMGPLRFVRGSHKYGNLEGRSISNESARFFENFIENERLEIVQVPDITAGSCSIHLGWTIHGAPANSSNKMREVMTANYFPDGARITDMSRSPDGLRFVGGYLPGQLANGPMNPIIYAEEDSLNNHTKWDK